MSSSREDCWLSSTHCKNNPGVPFLSPVKLKAGASARKKSESEAVEARLLSVSSTLSTTDKTQCTLDSNSKISGCGQSGQRPKQTVRKSATNWYSLPVIQVAVLGINYWLIVCTLFIHHIPGAASTVASSRRNSNPNVFSNQFALNIPAGDAKADEIASKYGYQNLGQIGSLSKFYLFEHSRIQKRSLDMSHEHHAALVDDPDVEWFEQQVEKRRVKRDFPYYEGPSTGSGGIPSYFSTANSFLSPSSSNIFQPTTSFLSSQQQPLYNGFFADPLFKEQWYLVGGSKDGFDMNVQQAWKRGFTGKGVVVSILDDGIQTNHPDLIHNYDPRASTDINDNDNDPTPQDNGDNKHGTRCAGEVAATAGNNICGVGIAYNASIGGVRMLDGTVNDAVEAKALGLNPEHVDIYSASWGPEDDGKTVDGPGPLARRAFIYGVTNGRRGLGSIFVWASGNGGRHVDSCNCDGYTNSIFTLSISSATQGGYKPWYLEECSSTLATTYSSGTPTLDKSVATCDMDGQLRPDHICTVEHTGTSASAPLAAGIAALALEANRNLSWRDLQHIVIMTSRPEPLEKEEGWFVNGVSRKFSHKFGYGLMDAAAVVDLALTWAGTPPQHICKSREIREDREIPGTHLGKLKVFMDVDGCAGTNSEIKFLEHVQCKISLRFFPRGNLRILLTSPMGTTSVLLFERPRDVSSSNFDDWPFLSVHFWGEQAHGRWTLEIVNSGSRRINQPGILKKWQLILYGTDVNPVKVRSRSLTTPQQPGLIFQSSSSSIIAAQQSQPSQPSYRNIFQQQHYNLPQEFLFPGASENVAASVQKPQVIRSQCQNDYWIPELAICVNDCPEGYYAASSEAKSKVCLPCPSRCRACTNSTSCASCEHSLVLHGQSCLAVCPEGYFEADSSCEPCQLSSCAACAGTMGTECVRCKHGLVLHRNQCVVNCPARFYATSFNECVPCTAGCESCDEEKCHMCEAGFELSSDEHSCVEANSACPVGLYLNQETGECHGCGSSNCLHCSGAETCVECNSETYLHNGDCLPHCFVDHFFSQTRNECFTCPKLCTRCESFETCTQCRDDGLLENGKCLPHCSNGFYNDRGNCLPCAPGCKTCTGRGDSECLTCHFGDSEKGGCPIEPSNAIVKDPAPTAELSDIGTIITSSRALQNLTCPEGYYLHKKFVQCYPCHPTCATCNDGNPYNCRSCHPPLRLDRGSSRCIECCQNMEDQNCCHCSSKRHAQVANNPLTRDLSAECHFVSRRVPESDQSTPMLAQSAEPDSRPKWSDSATMLSLFCISALCVLVAATAVMVQRQRRQGRKFQSRPSIDGASDEEFYTNAMTHSPKRYYGKMNGHRNKGLYSPVSLHEEDEEKLLNEESLFSRNQTIREEDEEDGTTSTNSDAEVDEFERRRPQTQQPPSHFVNFANSSATRNARSVVDGIPLVLKT